MNGDNSFRRPSFRPAEGFSLIEMTFAIAILGLALTVLYQAAAGSVRNLRSSSEFASASALAESVMEDFSAQLYIGKQGVGEFDKFSWRAKAEGVEGVLSDGTVDFSQEWNVLALVTVSVSWPAFIGQREIELHSVYKTSELPDEV